MRISSHVLLLIAASAAISTAGCHGGGGSATPANIAPEVAATSHSGSFSNPRIAFSGPDESTGACGSGPCVIQGTTSSTGPYIADECSDVTAGPGFCESFTYSIAVSGVPPGITETFVPSSGALNTDTDLTIGAAGTTAPGTYSGSTWTFSNSIGGDVPQAYSPVITVICSLREGNCASTPGPNAVYSCVPTPAPYGEAVLTFAKPRKDKPIGAGATPQAVLVATNSDGSCTLPSGPAPSPSPSPVPTPSPTPTLQPVTVYGQQTLLTTQFPAGSNPIAFDQEYGSDPNIAWNGQNPPVTSVKRRASAHNPAPDQSSVFKCFMPTTADARPYGYFKFQASATCFGYYPWDPADIVSIDFTIRTYNVDNRTVVLNTSYQSYTCAPAAQPTCSMGSTWLQYPLANGTLVYEISVGLTFATHFVISNDPSLGQELVYNSWGVVYPQVQPWGWLGKTVPFPDDSLPFDKCCSSRGSAAAFKGAIISYYFAQGYLVPPPSTIGPVYEAHHIHPLCWSGNEVGSNGVFLTNTANGGQHYLFTKWWNGFKTTKAFSGFDACSSSE